MKEFNLIAEMIISGVDPSGLLLDFNYLCVFRESENSLYVTFGNSSAHVSPGDLNKYLEDKGFHFSKNEMSTNIRQLANMTFMVYKISSKRSLTHYKLPYLYSVPGASMEV